jgi:hypothetical protein
LFPGARPRVSNAFCKAKEDDIQVFERAKFTNEPTLGWSAGTICMPDDPCTINEHKLSRVMKSTWTSYVANDADDLVVPSMWYPIIIERTVHVQRPDIPLGCVEQPTPEFA